MKRAEMNQVRLQVRRYALQYQEFTMNKLAEATGANRESLRTELARLIKEGKIESTAGTGLSPAEGGQDKASVGRPPRLYQLTKDKEKLEALRQSIICFHDDQDHSRPNRPTGSVFRELHAVLNRAMDCDATDRENLLAKADRNIEFLYTMHEESETTETFRAYLKMEELRIAYLRGHYGESAKQFEQLAAFFNHVGELEAAERAEHFAAICQSCDEREASFQSGEIDQTAAVYESLTAGSPDPLVIVSKQFVRKLYDCYEEVRRDHEALQQENWNLLDRLRQETCRFQDGLARLKNTFIKTLELILGRGTVRIGRSATRIGHGPARIGHGPAKIGHSAVKFLHALAMGDIYHDVSDPSGTLDPLSPRRSADIRSAIHQNIPGLDYFAGALDHLIPLMNASRLNESGDTLMGGPQDREEFRLEAVQLPTHARFSFPEENEKVWPWPSTKQTFELSKES